LQNEGIARAEVARRVKEIAQMLQIETLLDRSVGGLSGGDRQRVALGRAIVRQPKAFLMDEPLGTLDSEFRELMCLELRKLHNRLGATTVYVTHDQSEAMNMADTIAVMNQGKVLQMDSPDRIYNCPNCVFVGRFIGAPAMSFLLVDGGVTSGATQIGLQGQTVEVSLQLQGAARVLLGVRPERVSLIQEGGLRGEVTAVEYLGSHQIVTVQTGASPVRARVSKDLRVNLGEQVGLRFDPQGVILYDAQTEALLPSLFTERYQMAVSHG
jgi:multiple sugar transport system ATP-binding protein